MTETSQYGFPFLRFDRVSLFPPLAILRRHQAHYHQLSESFLLRARLALRGPFQGVARRGLAPHPQLISDLKAVDRLVSPTEFLSVERLRRGSDEKPILQSEAIRGYRCTLR